MNRPRLAGIALFVAAAGSLAAAEPRRSDEHVHWRPQRDVKAAIQDEIGRFEKNLKEELGTELLTIKPYRADAENSAGAALETITVGQILEGHFKSLRKQADHENEKFLPTFAAFRRAPLAKGGDILAAPVLGPGSLGHSSGNVTFKFEWEQVDGRFKNQWADDGVDEVYEVELNGMLTLGIRLVLKNDRQRTVISNSMTKPIVTGWRTSLVASEGKVQPILGIDGK